MSRILRLTPEMILGIFAEGYHQAYRVTGGAIPEGARLIGAWTEELGTVGQLCLDIECPGDPAGQEEWSRIDVETVEPIGPDLPGAEVEEVTGEAGVTIEERGELLSGGSPPEDIEDLIAKTRQ